MEHLYYVDDDITFRGSFRINNIAQTPDNGSAKVRILRKGYARGLSPYLKETTANISGAQIYYKVSDLPAGVFRLFFTASFNSGADQRTGIIDFVVRRKVAS